MATYTWEFGTDGSGLHFTITYDTDAQTFTVVSDEGKFDLNALWWNDGVADGGGVSLTKADNSLNMNGTGEDWDGMAKLSNAGLGTAGETKTSFISEGETAVFNLSDFGVTGPFDPENGGTLGVRATSVNGSGSIKLVDTDPEFHDDVPPPTDTVTANDDEQACGVEGLVPITGNVLANDTDSASHDLDITQVNGIALSTLDPAPDGDWYEFAIDADSVVGNDGTLKINAETGEFQFTYTGAGLPVGDEWEGSFTYTITDGDDLNDTIDSVHTATVDLCVDAAAGSPGYWLNHDASGPQTNDWDIAETTSFETYFGVSGPYSGAWDASAPVDGNSGLVNDITFHDALSLPNGDGGENLLAKEATTAVLNFSDEDMHDAFVTAYEYQRGVDFADDTALLNDLKLQVQLALDGDSGTGYSIADLTTVLINTHE